MAISALSRPNKSIELSIISASPSPSGVERAGGRESVGARLPYKGLSVVYNDSQAKLATKDDSRLRRYEIGFRPSFPRSLAPSSPKTPLPAPLLLKEGEGWLSKPTWAFVCMANFWKHFKTIIFVPIEYLRIADTPFTKGKCKFPDFPISLNWFSRRVKG